MTHESQGHFGTVRDTEEVALVLRGARRARAVPSCAGHLLALGLLPASKQGATTPRRFLPPVVRFSAGLFKETDILSSPLVHSVPAVWFASDPRGTVSNSFPSSAETFERTRPGRVLSHFSLGLLRRSLTSAARIGSCWEIPALVPALFTAPPWTGPTQKWNGTGEPHTLPTALLQFSHSGRNLACLVPCKGYLGDCKLSSRHISPTGGSDALAPTPVLGRRVRGFATEWMWSWLA
eukprot:gene5158-biopygen1100